MPGRTSNLADPALPALLGADLERAGYRYDAVRELIGDRAHAALLRNETTPAEAATRDAGPLGTLVRLFLLQRVEARAAVVAALPSALDAALAAGVLARDGEEVRAALDCRPYAADHPDGTRDWWVVSDLTPGLDAELVAVDADHVLGVSSASTSLAQLTVREPVGRALDLGTGCGVQTLHLAEHAREVVATDVNHRALDVARLTLALNGVEHAEVREGSLLDPVAGERFDLIATNPPFVISPADGRTGARLTYRDSGLPGDQVVERVVRGASDHLTEGGWCQVLANWAIEAGTPWDERLATWLPADADVLVVQREVVDPAAYVELWLRDAGVAGTPDYLPRYAAWLDWFDRQGIEGVGFGWINLHRTDVAPGAARHELLDHPWDVEQPVAAAVAGWGTAARAGGDVGRTSRLAARADVRQDTHGAPGAADPETIVLRQQTGLRRARSVTTAEAALVGACDGDLTVGQIVDAVAELLGLPDDGSGGAPDLVAEAGVLVADGYLVPADDGDGRGAPSPG